MNKIKAVIFDMDGVLIDTEPLNDRYYQQVFKDLGINATMDELSSLRGANRISFWSYFVDKYHVKDPPEEYKQQLRVDFIKSLKSLNVQPVAGVKELIRLLNNKKIPIAVASSASKIRVIEQLKLIGLFTYFKVIISGHDAANGKPHPELFLTAAKKLNVDPMDCIVIEDSTNGVKAGKAAGMTVIGFAGLPHNKQDLSEADKIIYSFNELTPDIIQSI